MDIENIDYEKLRSNLIDYFGAAMFSSLSIAIVDLSDVEVASNDDLLKIAKQNEFDLNEYQTTKNENKKILNLKKYKRYSDNPLAMTVAQAALKDKK